MEGLEGDKKYISLLKSHMNAVLEREGACGGGRT
jgi:hypothetical protein